MNISAFGLSLESTSWELSHVQALVTQHLNIKPMPKYHPATNSHPWWKGYYRIQKQSGRTARFSTPALVLLRYSNQCPVLTLSSWCCERGSTESFSGPRHTDCSSPASPNPSTPYQVHSSEDGFPAGLEGRLQWMVVNENIKTKDKWPFVPPPHSLLSCKTPPDSGQSQLPTYCREARSRPNVFI